ncbi:MAG TPA: DivIVA domain-containing protein [Solirubrobacteraceae bacterium]|nr:DivIVA domain-containing protein [Solirubrobacteraceae bacterium]
MSEELTWTGEGHFELVRRGYDPQSVDAYVAQLQRRIQELQSRVANPDTAVRDALTRVGEEVAGILQTAHETADDIVANGEREADDHRAAAERHAAEVTAIAEQRVHELDLDTDRIWAERERIVADARDLARQLQAVADLAAERFPEDPVTAAQHKQEQQQPAPAPAPAEERGFGFAGERSAGFDELNAGD